MVLQSCNTNEGWAAKKWWDGVDAPQVGHLRYHGWDDAFMGTPIHSAMLVSVGLNL